MLTRVGAASPGTVYLVGAGPGDPDLITLRGLELLESSDAVLHDELVHPALLRHVKSGCLVEYVGKRGEDPAVKQLSQSTIDQRLVQLARQGRSVVRLKGGDPFLFGRGSEEAEALVKAGIPFEVVPGVPSPVAAAAYAGISLTHRDLASSVVFVSGTTRHGEAFDFRELAGHRGTLCVFMGLRRIEAICAALISEGRRDPSTPAAVIQAGTRSDQRVVVGTLADIAERATSAALKSPALIVVGSVVGLREQLRWFDALPLFGKTILVGRAAHQADAAVEMLRRRGAEPISVPLLSIADAPDMGPVRAAVRALPTYDAVLFTSENAAERFMLALREEGLDARGFGRARVAAIGEGTRRALLGYGINADVVAASSRGEGLAEAVIADLERARGGVDGARVLLPRALAAREVLPDTLRARGAIVDVVTVYRTERAGAELTETLVGALGSIDAVMLTSGSMVDALLDVLGTHRSMLAGVRIASIGDVTTEVARSRGLQVDATATRPSTEGVIEALEEIFRTDPRP